MRDQMSVALDHKGIAGLADVDGADHVPDQLEIDVGDGDAGVVPTWATAIVM